MKTLLKIIGIIALAAVLLAAALLVYVSAMPAAPRRYTRTVETGGALEAEYLAEGERRVRRYEAGAAAPMEKFSVWYPEGEDVCPAVVLVNGTGVPASKYKSVFRHLASRGFIAVGNEDPGTWSGETARLTAQFLLEENARPGSPLYGRAGAEHGQMLYSANGYVLAWLSWQLMGDGHAAGAFTGPDAELARNPKYLS